MATLEELQDRVEYLEAVEGARRTILEYLLLHDLPGKVEPLIDLFAEDATLEISGYGETIEGTLNGRQAIGDLSRRLDSNMEGPATFKHVTTNSYIEITGDEATSISYLDIAGPATERGPAGASTRNASVVRPLAAGASSRNASSAQRRFPFTRRWRPISERQSRVDEEQSHARP